MSYVDITKPVVFNVTMQSNPKIDNFIRRMSIVSVGETTLSAGTSQEVNVNTYLNIIKYPQNNNTEFITQLTSYFTYSNNKSITIVEVGSEVVDAGVIHPGVQKIKDTYTVASILAYTNNQSVVEDLDNTSTSSPIKLEDLQKLSGYKTGAKYLITGSKTGETSTNIDPKKATYFDINGKVLYQPTDADYKIDFTRLIQATTMPPPLVTPTPRTSTTLEQVGMLEEYISSKILPCYIYLCPSTWYSTTSGFSALCHKFISETAQQYFMVAVTQNEDPTTSSTFSVFKDLKSLLCVYDNTEEVFAKTNSLPGAILGLIGSNKFDITETNKASPLNYKTLNSYKFKSLNNDFLQNLIQAPVNFVFDEIGLPTVGNGRYTDGSTFEYWYQWDLTQFALNNKLATMIVNGVNNPQYVIRYNQQGIDILCASIKSVLTSQQELGLITNFSQSVDAISGDLVGQGDIASISFNDYVKQNPEDYKNEIYNGISFYLMIGRYIRQVVLNVTLN